MRTSRLARDTNRVTSALTRSSPIPETRSRPTRNIRSRISLASLSSSTTKSRRLDADAQATLEETSSLSSLASDASSPEVLPNGKSNLGKRKRTGAADTSLTIESEDAVDTVRIRPTRGRAQKVKNEAKELSSRELGEAAQRAANISATVTVSRNIRSSPRKKSVKVEEDVEIEDLGVAKPKKARRHAAKEVVDEATGEVVIHPPENWEEMYRTTQEMRKLVLAPVDTMGCERIAEQHREPKVSSILMILIKSNTVMQDRRFQTLIALMLSSQTKDTVNAVTMRRLQTELPSPGLTLSNILAIKPERLNELIYAVGFHNNKTKFIKAAAEILRDQYDGDIPDTIEGLISLPGVGPKMAYLCMSAAWGRTEGIGVDVHVHRITNLWGWHKTKSPEETRIALQAWLPKDKWHEINHLLVGFGQTICAPVGRRCGECALAEKRLCPSAVVQKGVKVKLVKKKEESSDVKGLVLVKDEVKEVVIKEEAVAKDVNLP